MSAGFGWIDFSNDQRNRVYSVVEMLSEGGAVDELGIGSVRDAIADWLFPGVSTIQTRPKYFILLTDILLSYIQGYQNNQKLEPLSDYLRKEEHRLMHALANNHQHDESARVIGVNVAKNNGELARKPSSIYWNGLRVHKLIDTEMSLSEYLLHNDLSKTRKDEMDDNEKFMMLETGFSIKTPYFECIKDDIKLDLNLDEANYLKDQFQDNSSPLKKSKNLLGQLFTDARVKVVTEAKNFQTMAYQLLQDEELAEETKRILQIALSFDFIMHGAHIRYNIQLHNKSGTLDFTEDWENWLVELNERREEMEALDFDYVFNEVASRTIDETQRFMKLWQEEVLKEEFDLERLDELVYRQEIKKKGAKAKLTSVKEEITGWVGIRNLQYRFPIVKNIVSDIYSAYA